MRADCFKIVSQIAADLGGLHHLVNCVAYFGSESLGASEDDWDKTMKVRDPSFIRSLCPFSLLSLYAQVNVAGSSFMVQAAVEHMQGHSLEQNCSVVNLSSISAHQTQPNRQAL